eukprot:jgi/Tetstr1/421218/TSEL_001123.t1
MRRTGSGRRRTGGAGAGSSGVNSTPRQPSGAAPSAAAGSGGKVAPTVAQLMKGAQTRSLGEAVTLDLHNAGIELIAGLDACPKLRSCDLSFNKIAELKGLDTLLELRELKLYDNRLALVKGLLQLTALQTLDLCGNRIEHIEGVAHLKQLTTLRLAHNKLQELAGLGKMSGLQVLDASNNRIQAIEGLQGCTALRELNLNSNKITAISGLGRCAQLAELALNDNKLASLKGLRDIAASIDILWVAENQLESLRGMPELLPRLSELYLSDNKLTSLQPLDKCCPSLELLDVGRNKLASVKRLAVALSPLGELAEVRAEGNPICHQPEEQDPYRVRVLSALPQLRYLDEEEVTEAERMWIKCGRDTPAPGSAEAAELMPTQEEMEEFKAKMGIRSAVPAMGTPGPSRPPSAGPSRSLSRQGSRQGSRPPSAGGSRPGTASRVGALGRPSTPRAHGEGQAAVPAVVGAAGGNPLMQQRPPSARSATGAALMRPEEYETSLAHFTETMDEYKVQMESVVSQLRAGLALDLPAATAAVREGGMQGAEGIATAALPKPPQLPTFATRSDTDAALKREAREQAGAKKQQQSTATPHPPERSGGAAAPTQAAAPLPPGEAPRQRVAIPGVSDSIAAMPSKTSALLEHFASLFPSENVGGTESETGGGEPVELTPAGEAPPPPQVEAAPPRAGARQKPRGYKAAGGFTRVDMDDLGPPGPSVTVPAPARAPVSPPDSAPEARPPPVEPSSDAIEPQSAGSAGRSTLMAQLDALEAMVADYGTDGASDALLTSGEAGIPRGRRPPSPPTPPADRAGPPNSVEQAPPRQAEVLSLEESWQQGIGVRPLRPEEEGVGTSGAALAETPPPLPLAVRPEQPGPGVAPPRAAEGSKYSKFKLPTNTAASKAGRTGGATVAAPVKQPAARLAAASGKQLHSPRAGGATAAAEPGAKASRPTSGRLQKRAAGGMLARRG